LSPLTPTPPPQLSTLSLHDALPIWLRAAHHRADLEPDGDPAAGAVRAAWDWRRPRSRAGLPRCVPARGGMAAVGAGGNCDLRDRSEEHTSELQSLAYLVCRLLLEKK